MPIEGIVILIVALVALAALFTWMFATGFKNRWPKGPRVEHLFDGYKVTVIGSPGAVEPVDLPVLAAKGARIVSYACEAWNRVKGEDRKEDLKEVAIYFSTDAVFDKLIPSIPGAQAFLGTVRRRLGHGPILINVRATLVAHVKTTGEPVIHELMHALAREWVQVSDMHQDPTVWAEFAENEDSVQAVVRQRYQA